MNTMTDGHLGHLSRSDPLYAHIQEHSALQPGVHSPGAVYRVFKFKYSRAVYLYEERKCNVRIAAKFHENHLPASHPGETGENEFSDRLYVRSLGFASSPNYVVTPLGYNPGIGNALMVEYLEGDTLSSTTTLSYYGLLGPPTLQPQNAQVPVHVNNRY